MPDDHFIAQQPDATGSDDLAAFMTRQRVALKIQVIRDCLPIGGERRENPCVAMTFQEFWKGRTDDKELKTWVVKKSSGKTPALLK